MKSLEKFVALFAEQFEETDQSQIKGDTVFHNLDEWSSIVGMCVIAMIKEEFCIDIAGPELRECITVADVYNLLLRKEQQ